MDASLAAGAGGIRVVTLMVEVQSFYRPIRLLEQDPQSATAMPYMDRIATPAHVSLPDQAGFIESDLVLTQLRHLAAVRAQRP